MAAQHQQRQGVVGAGAGAGSGGSSAGAASSRAAPRGVVAQELDASPAGGHGDQPPPRVLRHALARATARAAASSASWTASSQSARRARGAAGRRAGARSAAAADDTLALILMCCRPELTPASAVALTLRAVGGLSTARDRRRLPRPRDDDGAADRPRQAGGRRGREPFELPAAAELEERLRPRCRSSTCLQRGLRGERGPRPGPARALSRGDPAGPAVAAAPEEPEVGGLLALMLLTDARRPARTDGRGELVPLAEQDRSRWDAARSPRADAVAPRRCAGRPRAVPAPGRDRRRATRARGREDTDWARDRRASTALLERVAPRRWLTLNRAVAVSMADGAGRRAAPARRARRAARGHHRLHAARAHLLERPATGGRPPSTCAPRADREPPGAAAAHLGERRLTRSRRVPSWTGLALLQRALEPRSTIPATRCRGAPGVAAAAGRGRTSARGGGLARLGAAARARGKHRGAGARPQPPPRRRDPRAERVGGGGAIDGEEHDGAEFPTGQRAHAAGGAAAMARGRGWPARRRRASAPCARPVTSAEPERAMGFCLFDSVAVAAALGGRRGSAPHGC